MNQSNFSKLMQRPPVVLWGNPEENHFTQTSPTPALYIFLPPEGQRKISALVTSLPTGQENCRGMDGRLRHRMFATQSNELNEDITRNTWRGNNGRIQGPPEPQMKGRGERWLILGCQWWHNCLQPRQPAAPALWWSCRQCSTWTSRLADSNTSGDSTQGQKESPAAT